MPKDIASGDLAQAVVQSVQLGTYPDSEAVISAELPANAIAPLLEELRKARDEVQGEIRQLSKDTAPDVDQWIAQAKRLQGEIEESKITAREIVQQAEQGSVLKERSVDAGNKIRLLEQEVAFNDSLAGTLVQIKDIFNVLGQTKGDIVSGHLKAALEKTRHVEASVEALSLVENTQAYGLSRTRLQSVTAELVERTSDVARRLVNVDVVEKRIVFTSASSDVPDHDLATVGEVLLSLGALTPWLQRLQYDLELAVVVPRLTIGSDGRVAHLKRTADEMNASERTDDLEVLALLGDLRSLLEFLATRLPPVVGVPFSRIFVPALVEQVISEWLDPRVPLGVEQMPAFEQILDQISTLAEDIDGHGWAGKGLLKDWVSSAPRTWLAKRRESALGSVRSLLSTGLRDRKTVERVETQTVAKGDVIMGDTGADDAWDEAWVEEEDKAAPVHETAPVLTNAEDDDTSAWDLDDSDQVEPLHVDQPPPATEASNDDDDAWGWNDEGQSPTKTEPAPALPPRTPKSHGNGKASMPAERELTLKETYTVTLVPDGIMEVVKEVVSDAEALADPSYAKTPIAPAASALYTLPTFALAMYRATASTSYSKLATGNMLIYNDGSRLADELRAFLLQQSAKDATSPLAPTLRPSSRLRLDNDIFALESFAKRAYGAEMESQRTVLRDLLDGAQGFSNCTVVPFASECDSAVALTVDRVREVARQWEAVLSRSALLQSLGSLLGTVTGKIIADVEDLADIGEEESKRLRSYCDSVASLRDLFVQEQGSAQDGASDVTSVYCANWFKFLYLAEILESSLADIKFLWTEGELALEFQRDELVDLVQALFADSEYRRRAIADIRRGGG